MKYDELIKACIQCIQQFDPTVECEDSFADSFLKKVRNCEFNKWQQVTKDTIEINFIKQVFYGVLRYKEFLKMFTESLFTAKTGSTERKDETLFHIFAYLTIFRLNELPIDEYKAFALVSLLK